MEIERVAVVTFMANDIVFLSVQLFDVASRILNDLYPSHCGPQSELSYNNKNKSAQSNLGRGPRRGAVAHVR